MTSGLQEPFNYSLVNGERLNTINNFKQNILNLRQDQNKVGLISH